MMTVILLTRPENQNESLQAALEPLGVTILVQPTIEIRPPNSWVAVDDAIRRLLGGDPKNGFDWLVFSSRNGVDFFFDRIRVLQNEESFDPEQTAFMSMADHVESPTPFQIAVVGPGTDESLHQRIGRRADVLPDIFTAEGVLERLLPEAGDGKRFLLLRASRGRDILKKTLEREGGDVTEVVVYQSVDRSEADPDIRRRMEQGLIDWTTVTSSAIARSLVRMFGETLRKTRLVSISPLTSATLAELGYPPHQTAKNASSEGIVEILATSLRSNSR